MAALLQREVFTISRELDYFTVDELEKQTGYARDEWWPGVIAKEGLDNALDACETAGVTPEIDISFGGAKLEIRDNANGIPAEVVKCILDYSTRTSDKLAYVAPTRGSQGNGLKTLLAIPYVLDGEAAPPVIIEARGIHHEIRIRANQITRRPEIDYRQEPLSVHFEGTAISFERLQPRLPAFENTQNVPRLISDYSIFNPHASFRLCHGSESFEFPPHNPQWRKWSPRDPTSAHWYTLERFQELVASLVSTGKSGTVRDFLAQFRGLKRNALRMQVMAAAGLPHRMKLEELADRTRGSFDREALERLLGSMQQHSAEVKPEVLGVLGRKHIQKKLRGEEDQSFRYEWRRGTENGLPYVVEAAFRCTDDELLQGLHVGLNWSVPLSNPLQDCPLRLPERSFPVYGLEGFLQQQRVNLARDPVALVLHIATPRFDFLDRGKGSVELPPALSQAVADTASQVIKPWASIKRKRDRDQARAAQREEDLLRHGRAAEIKIKEAAWRPGVMAAAYYGAAGDLGVAASRQMFYQARPLILEITGQETLDSKYFSQTLVPDYMREHPEETADWDVVYDDRGHLIEPHTKRSIGIGTRAVREYLSEAAEGADLPALEVPDFSFRLPTLGPRHRYSGILFIEKEGFYPLLERARIAELYDLAIASSKGMGTTAARQLLERLAEEQVRIFVLHDFDKSGFSILGILSRDTRRYQFKRPPEIIDLGLRLEDVKAHGLESEPVVYKKQKNPHGNLRKNGATEKEIKFLVRARGEDGWYRGQRVELNAFTSDRWVAFVKAKLDFHGVKKVVPAQEMLAESWRQAAGLQHLEGCMKKALPEAERIRQAATVPKCLAKQIARALKKDPGLPWDEALHQLTREKGPHR
jgi:DNA topoisomerase VI subunit B